MKPGPFASMLALGLLAAGVALAAEGPARIFVGELVSTGWDADEQGLYERLDQPGGSECGCWSQQGGESPHSIGRYHGQWMLAADADCALEVDATLAPISQDRSCDPTHLPSVFAPYLWERGGGDLAWTLEDLGAASSWEQASAACAAVGEGWRLPELAELQAYTCADCERRDPRQSSGYKVERKEFGNAGEGGKRLLTSPLQLHAGRYWLGTESEGGAWGLSLGEEAVFQPSDKAEGLAVRCVRPVP